MAVVHDISISFSSFPDTPFHPLPQDICITNPACFSYLENPLCSFNICFIFFLEVFLCLTVVCMVAVSPEVERNLPPHQEIKRLFLNQILQWPFLEKHHLYLMMKLNQIPDMGLNDNNIKIACPYTDGQMSRPLAACQFFLQPGGVLETNRIICSQISAVSYPFSMCQFRD